MRHGRVRGWLAVIAVVGSCALGVAAPRGAPAQSPAAPALTAAQMAEFLRTAPIVASTTLSTGVTRPSKLTLSAGDITHHAVFQGIDARVPIQRMRDGRTELNFRDSYHFNIAAYGLAQLLGLDNMVPVTVERIWEGRPGSLAWWIDAKWDETARARENALPPDGVDWAKQQSRMRVFSELLYDTDRNTGNMLITEDWRLWMIDFTRAFRLSNSLLRPENVQRCSRDLLTRLQALTDESVVAATKPHLEAGEVRALLKRRDRIVARVDQLVKQRGEDLVLF